ncbi:MAG TPA: DUF4440 domain-containing protein [Planococcus sp. (in: firmicutes)]|nr:DUF4440 domain-containing protein [Planococcus sp. (in: firmicutes)]
MKKYLVAAGLILVLAGCSDGEKASENGNTSEDGNASADNNAVGHGIEDGGEVGFTLDDDGNVQQAEVPAEEEKAILASYKEYIEAFNAEDTKRYMAVISENPEGFDREEDKKALEEAFAAFDTTYTTSDETIVKYEAGRAEVYATIDVEMKDPNSDKSTGQTGRQVVVFKKEDGKWLVSALHFIGSQ